MSDHTFLHARLQSCSPQHIPSCAHNSHRAANLQAALKSSGLTLDTVTLESSTTALPSNFQPIGSVKGSGGLRLWAIIVIAVVGLLVLITFVLCCCTRFLCCCCVRCGPLPFNFVMCFSIQGVLVTAEYFHCILPLPMPSSVTFLSPGMVHRAVRCVPPPAYLTGSWQQIYGEVSSNRKPN